MIRRPPRSTRKESSAASDVYKRQDQATTTWPPTPNENSPAHIRPRDSQPHEVEQHELGWHETELDDPAVALPPPRQPEPLIASRPWYIRSQLRLSLPQERRQLHVSAQPRPQRCQKMLNEPLSINFAQQVDVGLFAPAPQLVTDGLATVSYTHLTLPTTPYV